jgi:tripartite-type tricarboxylate transporter receptor subunit TctC
MRKLALADMLFAATFVGDLTATAQVYPSKPIALIVPFAAGGPTDALARLLGQGMSEAIKQPIIIENVGGAGSMRRQW